MKQSRQTKEYCWKQCPFSSVVFLYLTDIKGAFPAVKVDRFSDVFLTEIEDSSLRNRQSDLSEFLRSYFFTSEGELIVGASASSAIFSFYARTLLDSPFYRVVDVRKLIYMRFADNLTFSSRYRIGRETRSQIRRIIAAAGFQVNHGKSRVLDLRKGSANVMGVNIDHECHIYMPRSQLRKIYGLLHRAMSGDSVPVEVINGYYGLFLDLYYNHSRHAKCSVLSKKVSKQFQEILGRG